MFHRQVSALASPTARVLPSGLNARRKAPSLAGSRKVLRLRVAGSQPQMMVFVRWLLLLVTATALVTDITTRLPS
jgi:hypothetical protein